MHNGKVHDSRPNQPCLCGSQIKYKRCCLDYIQGKTIVHPDRLISTRFVANATFNIKYLWDTLHPMAPIRVKNRWRMFESEMQILKNLDYRKIVLVDEKLLSDDAGLFVQYVTVYEGDVDLSYIEETELRKFEGQWYYFDGLRRSSQRIGCVPETVKVGDLKTLFLHDSEKN